MLNTFSPPRTSAARDGWPEAPYTELWSAGIGAAVIGVAATPGLTLVAVASVERSVTLFTGTGELEWTRSVEGEAWAVAVSADESRIAVGTATKQPAGGSVVVFDRAGEPVWWVELGAPVWSVALSDDGKRLVAGSWNNLTYVFDATDGGFRESRRARLGEAGVYGVAISAGGDRILAAAYERSVILFDAEMHALAEYPTATGAYNTALSRDGAWGVAGLRDGRAMVVRPQAGDGARYTEAIASRPICGAAISSHGVAALGSFDGSAYLIDGEGRLLWSLDVGGEVWTTAISADGSLVAIGSGDGVVRVVRNAADDDAVAQLRLHERDVVAGRGAAETLAAAQRAVAAARRCGLVDYAVRRLDDWAGPLGAECAGALARQLLLDDTSAFPKHHASHFRLASILERQGAHRQAAWHYIVAGEAERLKLTSLTKAGEAFSRAGLQFAAKSAFRRAREQQIGEETRRALYSIGRAFEASGRLADARKYYEVVFTFSPSYRDVLARLERLAVLGEGEPSVAEGDWYESLLLPLLGPDVPRPAEVDASLHPVLRARANELAITAADRARIMNVIADHVVAVGAGSGAPDLGYDQAVYMRYDASVPEDEAKKSLELVHVLDVITHYGPFARSLDIGAATGRYPTLFASLGIEALGVDIEPEAVAFAQKKRGTAAFPDFRVGDARALPFGDASFNLITCMMGTAAHFPAGDLATVLAEVHRCLRPGGAFIMSTWDVECPHLTFLSLYSQADKEAMRRNSPSREQARALAIAQGFSVDELRPIGLMPEAIAYELDLQRSGVTSVGHLVDVDLAYRALFPAAHGQMYLMLARKR